MKPEDDKEDDATYKRNVRNMSIILGVIVLFVFGALYVSSILDRPGPLPDFASADSALGFSLNLSLNSTATSPEGAILATYWVNNTSVNTENISASSSWRVPPQQAGLEYCGGPLALGLLKGHFDANNYTGGKFLHVYVPCPPPRSGSSPSYYLIQSHTSNGVAAVGSTVFHVTLRYESNLSMASLPTSGQTRGLYTVFVEDEWGDIAILNFNVTT